VEVQRLDCCDPRATKLLAWDLLSAVPEQRGPLPLALRCSLYSVHPDDRPSDPWAGRWIPPWHS